MDANADANRTVFTLVGDLAQVVEGLFAAVACAARRLDMRRHSGVHQRLGLADVVPIVPLRFDAASVARCVEASRALGARLADDLGVPVFLYERSAVRPRFVALPRCRRGGYEALRGRLEDPADGPDLGPRRWSERVARTGATVLGVRDLLVAMNCTLESRDEGLARRVARELRTAGGGEHSLPALRAIGWTMDGYGGRVQVSTNLLDVRRTPPDALLDAVRRRAGVPVAGAELIGLLPARALRDAALRRRGAPVPPWPAEQILDPGALDDPALLDEGAALLGLDHLGAFDWRQRVLEALITPPS